MRVALLCSGLGHVLRGHEIFARDLFTLLAPHLDITLFKGGGAAAPAERVIPNVSRNADCIRRVHVATSARWAESVREEERLRIEAETFAYAAMGPLLEGGYDIVHCLEQDVCNIVFDNRHLFARVPKVVFSNGGAIVAADLPRCDAVQEHTPGNLARSARRKAFMIPHGVDMQRFRPGVPTDFRARHGIPADARLLLSVGSVCYWHKRMDHVIREVAQLPGVWLAIVGQETPDTPAIQALGRELLGERVVFTKLPHDELPQAYAAADAFVLGSLFETFGIVYIEALAMGVPVFCTRHPNQRQLVRHAVFVDMARPGALAAALRETPAALLAENARQGQAWAREQYDLAVLRQRYLEAYARIVALPCSLPTDSTTRRLQAHARNAVRGLRRLLPVPR
jgi:1,2-diacylglycerol 3-alpha-glucosyltransferase